MNPLYVYGENIRSKSSKRDLMVETNMMESSSHYDCYVAVRCLSNKKQTIFYYSGRAVIPIVQARRK